MAAETYYLLFSLIGLVVTVFWGLNLLYGRFKAKTLVGIHFKTNSPEHKTYIQLGRTRNLFITGAIALFFAANSLNSILRLTRLNTPDADFLLVAAPFITISLIISMIYVSRKEAKKYLPNNRDGRK
jgi:hypothetical protein